MYIPPFRYTDRMVNLIAEILQQIMRYTPSLHEEEQLRLRKANRIKTIHSSLAIEGNNLSEGQVRDIINGKSVIAPVREVREVKNAIATYELYPTLNPFDVKDLLRAHGTMMMALTDDAGHFRQGNVGVFGETGCVHLAPPADRVQGLISDLFEWLTKSDVHLLIRSCVFHYEFEFIHPFSDGNGRMGRLWQSLILGQLHPLFEHLPVENLVYASQQAYYDAIAASTMQGESTPFIEFMLGEILASLQLHQGEEREDYDSNESTLNRQFCVTFGRKFGVKFGVRFGDNDKQLLLLLNSNPGLTAMELSERLGVTKRAVEKQIKKLRELQILSRQGSTKNGLWKINNK